MPVDYEVLEGAEKVNEKLIDLRRGASDLGCMVLKLYQDFSNLMSHVLSSRSESGKPDFDLLLTMTHSMLISIVLTILSAGGLTREEKKGLATKILNEFNAQTASRISSILDDDENPNREEV